MWERCCQVGELEELKEGNGLVFVARDPKVGDVGGEVKRRGAFNVGK